MNDLLSPRKNLPSTATILFISFIGGAAKKEEKKKKKEQQLSEEKLEVPANETINIFSIASGHLYERFLRLAMPLPPLLSLGTRLWLTGSVQ